MPHIKNKRQCAYVSLSQKGLASSVSVADAAGTDCVDKYVSGLETETDLKKTDRLPEAGQ